MLFDSFGMSRMSGRIYAALLITGKDALSADELAQGLLTSRGSISTNVRILEQAGFVERFSKLGERRDSFRIIPEHWTHTAGQKTQQIRSLRESYQQGLEVLEQDASAARQRLEDALEFIMFWEQIYPRFLQEWQELQCQKNENNPKEAE